MSVKISHVTGKTLFEHSDDLAAYLSEVLAAHVAGRAWMGSTDLARRFQLPSFQDKGETECLTHVWDVQGMEILVQEVLTNVRRFLPLDNLTITLVPALPVRWFQDFGLSPAKWSNAFTNGPENMLVAIPAEPDLPYLANLIAHECHHACAVNPIYELSLDRFTVADWLKMEGTAEYFCHLVYPDERWWWSAFSVAYADEYWRIIEPHLASADDVVKGELLFGSMQRGIPTFAGYTFGYRMVSQYMRSNPNMAVADLFKVTVTEFIEAYGAGRST